MTYKYWLRREPKSWFNNRAAIEQELNEEQIKKWFPDFNWDEQFLLVAQPLEGVDIGWDFKKFHYYIDRFEAEPDPDARPITEFMTPEEREEWKQYIKYIK